MTGSGRTNARSRIKSSGDGSVDRIRNASKLNRRVHGGRNEGQSLIRIPYVTIKVILGFSVFAILVIFFLINHLVKPSEETEKKSRVITPFPAPRLQDLPQFQGEHKESLYWGTYRPHLYLGIRARTPRSLLAGLMWIGVKDGSYSLRHVCQESDGLATYGWTSHNGRDFGHQTLVDQGMVLETSFLKSKQDGSGYGGDWAVRINTQPSKFEQNDEFWKSAHLFFYLADEEGNALELSKDGFDIHEKSLLASGSRMDIGSWQLHMKSIDDMEVHFSGFRTSHMHNLSELVLQNLGEQARKYGRIQLSDTSHSSPNILVYQISARIPLKTDIVFLSGTSFRNSKVEERVSSLTGSGLTRHLEMKNKEFNKKFDVSFNVGQLDTESIEVGKAAISNMLGGIGYFYGQSIISNPGATGTGDKFLLYWPAELYTAVPSRSFFPRGFLWDEGFHQLLIWRWDFRICLDILGHWLDLMNIDGWIPREQILGAEARSKVPEEFIPQYPSNGNPPTLFLVLHDLLDGIKGDRFTSHESDEISSFLKRAFGRLEAWFQWFNTTQAGKETGSYFWHGRDTTTNRELNPKTLSSGLDDYPRASHPSNEERHLDLRSWMLLAAECMQSIAKLSEDKSKEVYAATALLLSDFDTLNEMHFDPVYGAYFDYGNHTEKVRLSWREITGGNHYATKQELVREVLEIPKLRLVPHIGYVSLFPFMGRIIPSDSWILEKQLDLISNKSALWTKYGLRSLAKTSSIYMKRNTEHDPPYWRGPIWMNMNYLILSSLNHYSQEVGPYREKAKQIYDELRENLIRNVVRNYHESGYLWEQYDQRQGKGKGCRPFTGWTSLILLIMSETYSLS